MLDYFWLDGFRRQGNILRFDGISHLLSQFHFVFVSLLLDGENQSVLKIILCFDCVSYEGGSSAGTTSVLAVQGGKDVVSLKMRKSETMCFLYVTTVGLGVGRRRKRMVAVGLDLQEEGWYVLVGQGAGYKMTCCWFVSDRTRGSISEYSFSM